MDFRDLRMETNGLQGGLKIESNATPSGTLGVSQMDFWGNLRMETNGLQGGLN